MKQLTLKEEEVMKKLWSRSEMTAREIMEMYPEPRPHVNTVSTFLRILEEKGWVKHRAIGTTNLYRASFTEDEMGRKSMKSVVSKFFHGSMTGMISSLIKNQELSEEEIAELRKLVNTDDNNL